jgi:hypothetical protein
MLNAFSGEETPGVVWRIKLGLRIYINKKMQPAEYTVFYRLDGVVYKDCASRRSDFVVRWFFFVRFCVGVLVICVLVFTVFCIVCTGFLYCFFYVYLFLFVLSVLVQELLPPSDNSIEVNSDNNNFVELTM